MTKIKVENKEITIISNTEGDFISLTDMANAKESESRGRYYQKLDKNALYP
jgi:hypothetical protein